MYLISNVERSSSPLCDGDFALLIRLQIPRKVGELWVVFEFSGSEGPREVVALVLHALKHHEVFAFLHVR